MLSLRHVVGVAAASALLAAGATACTEESERSDVTVTIEEAGVVFNDPREPIAVTEGTRFSIVLPSNPSTGYAWSVQIPPQAGLTTVGDGPTYTHGPSDAVGAGGSDMFTFAAGSPGSTTLTFTYARAGSEPAEERSVMVEVQPEA